MQMETQIVQHDILLADSAVDHVETFAGKTVGQFLILDTFPVAAAAEADDQIHVVR